eukprot:1717829-Amphidinium_carterae.2
MGNDHAEAPCVAWMSSYARLHLVAARLPVLAESNDIPSERRGFDGMTARCYYSGSTNICVCSQGGCVVKAHYSFCKIAM